ncbi:MAG: hypothetical protein LWX07_12535 [Bacteroidetes bacterium]|nr:hypothetical protein [Bacteroidota bacterium]
MTRHSLKILILFFASFLTASAQLINNEADTLILTNVVRNDFYNDLNAANLNSAVYYNGTYSKLRYYIKNNFNSSVTKFSDNFSTDNNNLYVTTDYALSKNVYAGGGVISKLLTGNKDMGLNKGYNNFFFTSLDFVSGDLFSLDTKFGIKNEKQIDVYNTGLSGSLEGRLNRLLVSGFESSGILRVSADEYGEKTNYTGELYSDVRKQFSEYSENESVIRAYTLRTDFYTPATISIIKKYGVENNIQSRYDNYILLSDNLSYKFTKDLSLKVKGAYFFKNIQNAYQYKPPGGSIFLENIYNNRINENLLQAGIEVEFKKGDFVSKFNGSYSEREENHKPTDLTDVTPQQQRDIENVEMDKNNNSKTSVAYLEVYYHPSALHTFRFQGGSSLMRYDTESQINYDDRDELLFNAVIAHRYYNLRNFYVETSFEFNSSLLDYIYKQKSANNNTNKVYKLNSISIYSPVRAVTTKNYFQVLANYTVYKYEDIVSQVQSFSFRQMYLSDSTDIRISRKFTGGLYGVLKVYEQGQFNNANFSVKPTNYSDERTLGTTITYEMKEFVNFFIGFRHYIRRYYNYEKSEKVLKRTQAIYGPYAGIRLNIRNNSSINVLGGIDKYEATDNSLTNTSKNLIINILWNI